MTVSGENRAHLIRKALNYVGEAFLYRLEGGERDGEYVVASSITSSLQFLRKRGTKAALGEEVFAQAMSNLSDLLADGGASVRLILERPEVSIFASDEEASCGECLFEVKDSTDIRQVMLEYGYEVVDSTLDLPGAAPAAEDD